MNDFSSAKIGQTVYCLLNGYGTIADIDSSNKYPLKVNFSTGGEYYTFEGLLQIYNSTPVLYWDKPEIIAPSAPPTIKLINGIEVPDISFQPKENERYYFPKPTYKNLYSSNDYNSEFEEEDVYQAQNGMCYPYTNAGKEAAILHGKAMLGITD